MELFLKTVFVKTQILIYFNLQNARNLIRVWIKEISSEYDMRIMGNSHEFCGSQLVTAKKLAPLCADQIELQHPPPPPPPSRANPRHLTIFCARGVGNLTDKAFPGVGNLTLPGWVGENWTWSVRSQTFFLFFFFRAPNSLTAINTCLDEIEGLEGRDIAFVSDWLTKKWSSKVRVLKY